MIDTSNSLVDTSNILAGTSGVLDKIAKSLVDTSNVLNTVKTTAVGVDGITHSVGPIDHELDSVKLVAETNRIAAEILIAAEPLSGQAQQIIDATAGIAESARSINGHVLKIGETVNGIDTNARSINGNVTEINKAVKDINGTAKAISGTVNQIDGNVTSIGGTVKGIDANLAAVLETAKEIRGDHAAPSSGFGSGIAGINRRRDAAIALVGSIKTDTANILVAVLKIEASAKSIEAKIDPLTKPAASSTRW